IFTRPQWRSWLVKGAFIIAGYSIILAVHFLASLLGAVALQKWLALGGIPLSIMTAIYTAYLFAQAKARDLWQSPLLPPHLLIQALLLGSIALISVGFFGTKLERTETLNPLFWIFGGGVLLHTLCVIGEITLTHPTAHARLATHELVRGRYRKSFWLGLALVLFTLPAFGLGILADVGHIIGLGDLGFLAALLSIPAVA